MGTLSSIWIKIRDYIRWILGEDPEVVSNPDCPTCGPDVGPGTECGEDEPECDVVSKNAQILNERYDYIHTKNKYKPVKRTPKPECSNIDTQDVLVKTKNRCKYKGEVRSFQGRAMVCLECGTCLDDSKLETRSSSDSTKTVLLSQIPTGDCMATGTCPEISCGFWYYINYARRVTPLSNVTIKNRFRRNRNTTQPAATSAAPPASGGGSGPIGAGGGSDVSASCTPELIYDASGCKVIGIKPVLLARGKLAYWESTENYPLIKDCEGNPIYGEDAGYPIRHNKMPSRSIEPHFLSKQTGVVSHLDPGNKEWNNTYVRFIQLELRNVKLPENTAKPLNKENPLTLMIIPRTDSNKSVRASGLFINTFKGNIHGEEFAIPKNGLNGPDYFDKNIYYGGNDRHRGGENMDKFAMVFHGPETQFDKPALDSDTIKFELNLFGKGWQYGNCAEGEVPDSAFVGRENQKGTRASINLSHYVPAKGDNQSVNKCIQAIDYVDANSVKDKGERFTYPLLNLYRESSVYVEAKGPPYRLRHTKNSTVGGSITPNNGHPGRPNDHDGTSDLSFLGATLHHEKPIYDGSAFYGNLKTYIPDQYGGLVNATYIDLYPISRKEIEEGLVVVDRGDSFIGQHYVVRKSYVSDKIMRDISPLIISGGLPNAGFMGGMLRKIFDDVGLEECATCPESSDVTDPRNGISFTTGGQAIHNELRVSDPAGPWNGTGAPPAPTGSDIYFFNVLKTQIIFVCESDVNLYYRQVGNPDAGEFYYRKLKGNNLDSSFPLDSDWRKGMLNRFYVLSKENPKWKMIFRVIVNILWTYAIGLYLIISGLNSTMNALANLHVGLSVNIGAIGAAILNVAVVALGVIWIIFWSRTDLDNRFWDNLLGIDGCWPDIIERTGNTPTGWRIRDGRLRQFEDNYWAYNWDYSRPNLIQITLGLPDPYSTCDCPGDTTFEILYSNKQNPTSMTDAYKNFKVNSYIEIPSNTGKIKKMLRLGNRVFVQTSDAMYSLQTGASEMQTKDGRSVYLKAYTALQVPVEIFGGPKEGRGGTSDPNACVVTKWGYINVDVEAREIALFTGDDYIVLGEHGMIKFLDRFMAFEDTTSLRDEKTEDGVGYSIGVDNARKLIFITKRDHSSDKKDRHWTLTYSLDDKSWIGFEYFHPVVYLWDRFRMFTMHKGKMWMHNNPGEYSMLYGESVSMILDFVIRDTQTRDTFKWAHSTVDVDFDEWRKEGGFKNKRDLFFTEVGMYNSHQSSGLMPTVNKETMTTDEKTNQDPNILPVKYLNRRWRFEKLVDKVTDQDAQLFTTWFDSFFTDFNDAAIQNGKANDQIVDNYMIVRFVFQGDKSIRVLLKQVDTSVNSEEL